MIYKLVEFLSSKSLRTFLIAILFHFSLYFSTSNKMTFLLSIILLLVLYQHLKKIPLTLFYLFIIMLPFAKGKGLDILILEKQYIKNARFDVDYLFSIYFSSVYLGLFYLYFIREKIFKKVKPFVINKNTKIAIAFFLLFILTGAINSIFSAFEIPVFLSSLQLLILLFIFFTPFILKSINNKLIDIYMVIASSTLFQSMWLILQTINKGHLQKDIEVFLSIERLTNRSTENRDIIRAPGTFFESSMLGTFLLTNLSILIYILVNNKIKDKKQKKVISFIIVLTMIAIILTGSRAIYGILLLLILFFAYTKKFFSNLQVKTILTKTKNNTVIIPMIILGVLFVTPYFINRITSSQELFSKEGSGTYRIQLTQYAVRLTQKKPILGVGLNLSPYFFATAFPTEDYFIDPAHPHNILVQILAETGVVGFAFFTLFIYFIFRPLIKRNFQKVTTFELAAATFFICSQLYPIFINQMEIISYLFLYLGFAAHENSNET